MGGSKGSMMVVVWREVHGGKRGVPWGRGSKWSMEGSRVGRQGGAGRGSRGVHGVVAQLSCWDRGHYPPLKVSYFCFRDYIQLKKYTYKTI